MRFRFIGDHVRAWPVRLMCRVLQVSASGYYAWRRRPESTRSVANRRLLDDVQRLHGEHRGRHGSPRIHAAEIYTRQLAAMSVTPSMSHAGRCYDNAPMESFFHALKAELVHQRQWSTRAEARRDLLAYIEGYHDRRRIHSALGYRTPGQAEHQIG